MFVYFNRLLFKSIFLLPLLHFISLPPFFLSFPSHISPLFFFFASLPPFLSFFTLPFPTPPFHPISPFPPISSSLIPPLFSLRSLLSLGASLPSNPLFLSYSSINPTPSFFYPFIPSYPSIPSYRSFPSYPCFPSFPLIPSYHSIHSYPFFPSYTLLFLPIPPSLPPLLFFISLIYLFATSLLLYFTLPLPHFFSPTSSLHPLFPTTPSLPTPPFFPTIYRFIPTPSFSCLPPSISFPLLFATSTFILTPPSLPLSLPHPLPSLSPFPPSPFHPLIIPSAFHLPPSFALLHYLSPYKLSPSLFLPTSSLALSLSLPFSPSLLPLTLQNVIFLSLLVPSLSSSFLLFTFTPSLSSSLSPLHLFPTSLSPSVPSLCCVLYIAQ